MKGPLKLPDGRLKFLHIVPGYKRYISYVTFVMKCNEFTYKPAISTSLLIS